MFTTWTCNETPDPIIEYIKRAAQCRQLEYKKHIEPERLQQKYEDCIAAIPRPLPKTVAKVSLGSPIGTSFGTFGIMYLKPENVSVQAYACCLIALGMAFIVPVQDWSSLVINQILEDGKKLIENSANKNDVIATRLNENSINKRFVINNNMIEVEIFECEYTGKVDSTDITVPNLLTSLKKFFKFSSYCILWFDNGTYYFIWRKHEMFFIWDSYGRDQETLIKKLGLNAVLVALRCPENLYHFIVNLGNMKKSEMFSIRKVQISTLIENCATTKMADIKPKPTVSEFQILGDKYAILRGHIHVGAICFKEFRYKQSLAVAIIALLYSKIAPPCSWDKLIVDEIVILGTIFYKVWNSCAHCFDLVIYDVPKRIRIGQYMVDISVSVQAESGEWKCVSNYKRSALTKSIKRSFLKSVNIMLQIEGKTYAIWKRNDIYYIFDPYEHQANRGEIERYKSSILHMCSTVNQCCLILTQLILEIPTVRSYHIHTVRILNISDCRKSSNEYQIGKSCCLTGTNGIQDNDEAITLNESVEDLTCNKIFRCLDDIKEDDIVSFADLDSPGMSETQIPRDYFEIRGQIEYEAEIAEAEKRLKEELERKLAEKRDEQKSVHEKDVEEHDGEVSGEEGDEEFDEKEIEPNDMAIDADKEDRHHSGNDVDLTVQLEKNEDLDRNIREEKVIKDKKIYKDNKDGIDIMDNKDIQNVKNYEDGKKDKEGKEITSVMEDTKPKDLAEKDDVNVKTTLKSNDNNIISSEGKVAGKTDDHIREGMTPKKPIEGDNKLKVDAVGDGKEEQGIKGSDHETKEGSERKSRDIGYILAQPNNTDDEQLIRNLCKSSDEDDADLIAKICKPLHPCAYNKMKANKNKSDTGREAYKQKCNELNTSNAVQRKRKEIRCPAVSPFPKKLAVIGTEKCTFTNLSKLFKTAFKCTDRILVMTKFGNYVVFTCFHEYYLFDGCTCKIDRFRYLDLSTGTAGFIHFNDLDEVIKFILSASDNCRSGEINIKNVVQDICDEYC